ncbi:MAG TPA: hypothetical protein VF778_05940 [Xanthobacteraceae bacterium]
MIKASAKGQDGRDLLVLGLTFGNLQRFREQPRDTFIKIDGKELGLAVDVVIFSCETEAKGAELMEEWIGPKTKVTVAPKLKS